MKTSDYVIDFLFEQGVSHIFEVIGGMTTHLIDSADRQGKIQLVSMHHEQAAAFAAEAMARMTGIPGVALATSGPGATNLLTGIGSCYFDSVPAVFITGQVNVHEQKGDRAIRQLGFQETDIVSMARPITKAAWSLTAASQVPEVLAEAFRVALADRPGPVLLDLPMDVQRTAIFPEPPVKLPELAEFNQLEGLVEIFEALEQAQRPVILAGGGLRAARATTLFRELSELLQIPVVNSLMAVDVLPYADPLRTGLIGSYGNRWANMALGNCDVLLVLGSRLDIRQTGADTASFQQGKQIFHVDCAAGEINNRIQGCRPILADLRNFLAKAIELAKTRQPRSHSAWLEEINQLRRQWPDTEEATAGVGINPNRLMHHLAARTTQAAAYVVDVGNHQMWAAQSLELGPEQRFLTSGGMGAMGFSLPAAIGASYASPGKAIVQISGDGSFQINLQELETVAHHQLPIKMVVLNNQSYGMVRQFQQSYFSERYVGTVWGYSAPDFCLVAKAYGLPALTVNYEAELEAGLAAMWREPLRPFLLQIHINPETNVYPKIAFGHPITEMEPFFKPQDMEGT